MAFSKCGKAVGKTSLFQKHSGSSVTLVHFNDFSDMSEHMMGHIENIDRLILDVPFEARVVTGGLLFFFSNVLKHQRHNPGSGLVDITLTMRHQHITM